MLTPESQLRSSLLTQPTSDLSVILNHLSSPNSVQVWFLWPPHTSQPSTFTTTSPSTSERPRPPSLSVSSERRDSVSLSEPKFIIDQTFSPRLEPLRRLYPHRHGHLLGRPSVVLPQPQHLVRLSAFKFISVRHTLWNLPPYLLSETLTNRLFDRILKSLSSFLINLLCVRMARGALIIFEGVDRSGKSTQIKRIFNQMVNKGEKVYLTRFPEVSLFTFIHAGNKSSRGQAKSDRQ